MKNLFSKAAIIIAATLLFGCSSDNDSNDGINNVECPPGFTGQNCDIPLTPSKIRITKIRVYKFPNDDGTTGWDGPGSSPDIYLSIDKGSTNIFESSEYYPNAISDNQSYYEFMLSNPIVSNNTSDIFDIQLWDYDQEDAIPSDNDFIGGIYFAPFTEENKTSMYISDLDNSIKYEVFLSYEW
jgi:hypothetical protein